MAVPRIDIVDYEPGLAAAFRDLNVEWLARYFEVEPVDEAMLSRPGEVIVQAGGAILFARTDDAIVGTAALKHHGDGVYELTKMAVTERWQGRGIGRRLVEAAIEKYRTIGGRRLYLESHSSLAAALALYESSGFEHRTPPAPSEYRRADVYMVFQDGE